MGVLMDNINTTAPKALLIKCFCLPGQGVVSLPITAVVENLVGHVLANTEETGVQDSGKFLRLTLQNQLRNLVGLHLRPYHCSITHNFLLWL